MKKKNQYEGTVVKQIDMSIWLETGEQYCPDCHQLATHKEEDEYWECDICKWSITDEEAEEGLGYPTLEATYEENYFSCFESNMEEDIPEVCDACGGPYPDCQSGCRLFRE